MNRARKKNKGLPRRVYVQNGAYRFLSPVKIRNPREKDGVPKFWITLARVSEGEAAMLTALAQLLGSKALVEDSMPYLCTEFKANKLSRYSEGVQDQYKQYLDVIADDFENYLVIEVTTKICAEFLRNKFKTKTNTIKKYAALMRKVFKYAISELGLRQDNPIDQLDLSDYESKRREILPTHAQVEAIRAAGMTSKVRRDTGVALPTPSGPMFGCIVDMTYLCWARAIDVRLLKESQIDGDWIRFKASKTAKTSGKVVDIFITPQLRAAINRAKAIKKEYKVQGHDLISPYLFPTRKGTPYTKNGLYSMWDRARDRLGIDKDSPPALRIQFRDLRALGATDAARTGEAKEEIRKRLSHTTTKTSEIYIKDAIPEQSSIDLILPWKSV